MLKRNLKYFINFLLLISVYVLLIYLMPNKTYIFKIIILSVLSIIFFINIILSVFNKKALSRFFYVLFLSAIIILWGSYLFKTIKIFSIFTSISSLKSYIINTGSKGIFIYILIQILQVVFLPIPAAIICIVGSVIYGPLLGAIYCSIGVILGSFVSFCIGKTFGYKIVSWIVGKDSTDKYLKIISKNGGLFLVIAFLLPMFPDDILCLIAGITKMKSKTFSIITTITRPIGVIFMSFFGSGSIIPFAGWGLLVWGVILIFAIVLIYLSYKKQDEIQAFILNKIFKKNKCKFDK